MGAVSPPQLAAAVSEAGALGMVGTARPGGSTLSGVEVLVQHAAQLTAKPFGVNFLVPPMSRPNLDLAAVALAARSARVVEFFYGWPERELIDLVHQGGALVSWQIGSREEAVAAADLGCDVIVAQCLAAGGHVRGTIGLAALLAEVLPAVDVPVLASGGIGDARAIVGALAMGASGVRMGTRFVATPEANAHPIYLEQLIAARASDAVYTEVFSATWPNAPHRCLRSCIEAANASSDEIVGDRRALDGSRVPVPRFGAGVTDADTRGNIAAMSLWAGESVGAVSCVQPAAEIVRELALEVDALLERWTATQSSSA